PHPYSHPIPIPIPGSSAELRGRAVLRGAILPAGASIRRAAGPLPCVQKHSHPSPQPRRYPSAWERRTRRAPSSPTCGPGCAEPRAGACGNSWPDTIASSARAAGREEESPRDGEGTLHRCCRTSGGGGQRLGPRRHVSNFGETRFSPPHPAPLSARTGFLSRREKSRPLRNNQKSETNKKPQKKALERRPGDNPGMLQIRKGGNDT
ncbi:hypothetical protein Nmel_003699, partial [Mimus melanotis]